MKNDRKIASAAGAVLIALLFAGAANSYQRCSEQIDNIINISAPKLEHSYSSIEKYRVQSFDTLSSIAVKYIPSNEYMSQWISDVKRLNNRKSNDIYYGEVIKVYVYEK